MSKNKVPEEDRLPELRIYALKSVIPALVAGGGVFALFALWGGNPGIAIPAGLCTLVGIWLCALGWSYFKAMERYYRQHPQSTDGDKAQPPAEKKE